MIDPEPTRIFPGDTVTWVKSLSDYPAPDWILQYDLVAPNSYIQIPTIASDTDHLVNVDAATTATWDAGHYNWVAKVKRLAESYSVDTGVIDILVNAEAQQSGFDARSNAKKIVDNLEKAYVDLTTGKAMVVSYSIGDSVFTYRSADDILPQLNYWRAELGKEEADLRVARGLKGRRTIKVYF